MLFIAVISFSLPDAIDNNDWLTIHIYTIDIR